MALSVALPGTSVVRNAPGYSHSNTVNALRGLLKRERAKTVQSCDAMKAQMKHYNEKEAVRPDDLQSGATGAVAQGSGTWRKWLPQAFLRCAFGAAANTGVSKASEFKGSRSHCSNVQACAAELLHQKAAKASDHQLQTPHTVEIQQVQLDETHFVVAVNGGKGTNRSILGVHGLLTTADDFETIVDTEQPCPPKALEDQTAACMWGGVKASLPTPLVPEPGKTVAKWRALIVATDRAKAMELLQAHAARESGKVSQFIVKAFCKQHGVGRIMWPLSLYLDVTCPVFCLVKQLHSGSFDTKFWIAIFEVIYDNMTFIRVEDQPNWVPVQAHREHAECLLETLYYDRNLHEVPEDDADRQRLEEKGKLRRLRGAALLDADVSDWRGKQWIHWNKQCGCQTSYDAAYCTFTAVKDVWCHCFPVPALSRFVATYPAVADVTSCSHYHGLFDDAMLKASGNQGSLKKGGVGGLLPNERTEYHYI